MSKKHSKKYQDTSKKIEKNIYEIQEGLAFLLENSKKQDSIDIAITLDINPKKSDQVVKGIVVPPSGLGKKITIAVLTEDIETEKELKLAGATYVGNEELAEKIKTKEITADIYLATKTIMMNKISKMGLAGVLRSKMPNLKTGTIVENKDLINTIKTHQKGQIVFRSNGQLIQTSIGRASFSLNELLENFNALINAVNNAKPSVIKIPNYIKKIFISSTMSPSLQIAEKV